MSELAIKAAKNTLRKKTAKLNGDMKAALKEIAFDLAVLPSSEGNHSAWEDRKGEYAEAYRILAAEYKAKGGKK